MNRPAEGWRRPIGEALGTYLLVFIGPGAAVVDVHTGGGVGHVGVALAFAFVVAAAVYSLGHLSGAHINPAVTLGFWSAGRFPGRDVVPYLVAQCCGAVGAAATLRWMLGEAVAGAATLPAISDGRAFAAEWLLSFALMFVIMAVATDERVSGGAAGIAIGLTVGFCALMGGPLTGASMNPARTLGPAVASGAWDSHWIYWVAPVSAMVVAVRTYEYLRPSRVPRVIGPGVALGLQGPLEDEASARQPVGTDARAAAE